MAGEHEEIYRRLNRIETTLAGHIAEVKGDIANLREDVQEIARVVVRGNGDSLVTRLRIVERDVEAQGRQLAGLRSGNVAVAQEGVRGRWSAVVAGIAAAGAVVGALLTTLAGRLFAGGGH